MPVDVRRGWQARYFTSATSSSELTETNKHRQDAQDPDWRTRNAGTPTLWMEDGGQIIFVDPPATAPTSGYPRVELYNNGRHVLNADSELPGQVSSIEAWSWYIKWQYAENRGVEGAERMRQLHKMALRELAQDIQSINARDDVEVHSWVPAVVNL